MLSYLFQVVEESFCRGWGALLPTSTSVHVLVVVVIVIVVVVVVIVVVVVVVIAGGLNYDNLIRVTHTWVWHRV